MRVRKILITEMGSVRNKGNLAILKGTLRALAAYFPEAEFSVLSHGPREELTSLGLRALPSIAEVPRTDRSLPARTVTALFGISKLICALVLSPLWRTFGLLRRPSAIDEYMTADVIVVRGADMLTDAYGRFKLDSLFMWCAGILLGIVMGKPTVVCGHSVGPFDTRIGRGMARFTLNRASLVTVREGISKKILSEMNMKNPNIFETTDLAFLLQPVSARKARQILLEEGIRVFEKPMVGVSASRLISTYIPPVSKERTYRRYIDFMTNITTYIVENLHAEVVFVPHVVGPGKDYDDRLVSEDIQRAAQGRKEVKIIRGDYSPEELKGIIGLFDMFIGCRMHAVISAVSMKVPSLALSYLHKSQGVMEAIGQDKWIYSIQDLNYNSIVAKIASLWNSREVVRQELEERIPIVEEKAFRNAQLIQEMFRSADLRSKPSLKIKTQGVRL